MNNVELHFEEILRKLQMSNRILIEGNIPLRTKVWKNINDYDQLDKGIRFAVRALHAHGIETCQSCEGGEGHAYSEPSVDILAGPNDVAGFNALACLVDFGLPVSLVSKVWNIKNGMPYECIWRIIFNKSFPERADEEIMFIWGYQAQELERDK